MAIFHVIDDYGIKEYKTIYKVLTAFGVLYTYIAVMAYPLYVVEKDIGNITTYGDAFYLLQMAISTIGFGDLYPMTTEGRWLIAGSFYVGVGLAGYIGSLIATALTAKADNSVLNRELRKQNEEILDILRENNGAK